ncbi:MAG: phosphonate ABC transporter, permease protein PhnE [Chloroflexi bacterium]|nr:phosphonate ABC transporter, permease protein PhnE [Chloroflexota bacterium]MBI3339077.1 phosphonate ABC transporter, permease protein PhnE [Chloroflexota bacterium]
MTTSQSTRTPSVNPALTVLSSLILPGLGQVLLKKRGRGLMIFLATAVLAFLINWSFVHQNIAKVTLGGMATSWLWLALILFWVWNVLDVSALRADKAFSILPGIVCTAVILYVIAWNVTDVKLGRLIERFNDARSVAANLLNPDMITISVNGQDQICSWGCIQTYVSDKLAGRPTAGTIRPSDNLLDIFGRVKPLPAPKWQVNLGLAAPDSKVNTFVAGSMIETIAMGLMATLFSTILAIPISFFAARNIMSRLPGGMAIYYAARGILNVVRAIDTIVWGLIVIVWVGLGTFAGVVALTIHSVAALGKLFSEEIEHIDPGPVEAVTASGANLAQTIRFAVIPQLVPSFLAYSLLRWDINMRSATVIGFVAGGGIGFFVIETVRMGGYQQYATALWAVAVVIMLVDYISEKWRESILKDQPQKDETKKRPFANTLRTAFYVILGTAVFAYGWNITEISIRSMLNPGKNFGQLILDFISIDLSQQVVQVVFQQMLVTIFQAMLATTLGALIALPFSFLAAKNLTGRSLLSAWIYYLTRGMFNILRSIEALLYVVIFIFWVGIGPFAGMLALAVTSFALIGKLFSESIENIELGPIEAVNATGADRLQTIAYAVIPQIIPPFVSYLLYQWDINVRMATIIGFAGGGGIGLTLTTFFGSLQYHKAGTVVAFIVIVVALMDFASAKLREELI